MILSGEKQYMLIRRPICDIPEEREIRRQFSEELNHVFQTCGDYENKFIKSVLQH